ncbi:MAG TPA: hypothetical protein VJM08_11955 [Anaerolineales bacterium]|nr:hypothetical protein [Anaerolineales bacterium]
MPRFEYLQININYYFSSDGDINPSNEKDIVVWKGFQDYLDFLNAQGGTLIHETKAESGLFRTYQFKRPID